MTRSVSFALALLLAAPLPALAAAPASPKPAAASKAAAKKTPAAKTVKLPDGLQYTDLKVGTGPMPQTGDIAVVHYTGTFPDGKKFDSSRDANKPFEFPVGMHKVIPCWDEGVATMRVGGRRKLVCPPSLAYAERGAGNVIPPDATLIFDIELLGIKKKAG